MLTINTYFKFDPRRFTLFLHSILLRHLCSRAGSTSITIAECATFHGNMRLDHEVRGLPGRDEHRDENEVEHQVNVGEKSTAWSVL